MKAPSGGTKPDAEWLQSTNILRVSGKEHSGGFVFPAHSERDTVSGKTGYDAERFRQPLPDFAETVSFFF